MIRELVARFERFGWSYPTAYMAARVEVRRRYLRAMSGRGWLATEEFGRA
jgi:hypothetical protein